MNMIDMTGQDKHGEPVGVEDVPRKGKGTLQPACSVPDGWRLVPIDPTPEMIDAAGCGWVIRPSELRKRLKVYRAMIDAAPTLNLWRFLQAVARRILLAEFWRMNMNYSLRPRFKCFDFRLIRCVAHLQLCILSLKAKNLFLVLLHEKDVLYIRFLEWQRDVRLGFHIIFFH